MVLVAVALLLILLTPKAFGRRSDDGGWKQVEPRASSPWTQRNPWIRQWTRRDHDLGASIAVAAHTFHVSASWLAQCKDDEGGDTGREVLRWSLRSGPHGRGWNLSGSYAFGPWQFMLDDKPAGPGEYGTFGRYVHAAFAVARRRGLTVPFRFKTPDSYVGQALTAAFMFAAGQSGQWSGARC